MQGYVCQSEIVFLMKGLTPARIVPIISIQKMANDFEVSGRFPVNCAQHMHGMSYREGCGYTDSPPCKLHAVYT